MGCSDWVNGPASRTFAGPTWDVVRMVLGEFVGTFILLFLGLSACINWTGEEHRDKIVQIAFAFGLSIACVIYMMGPISGAHINPGITVASMISGRINATKGILYIFVQCLGAIAGSGAVWLLLRADMKLKPGDFGCTLPNPGITSTQCLFGEIMQAMIFILVFLSVTDVNWSYVKGSASLAIGFTAVACILAFGNVTGTSLNPARSLGPAVIMGHIDYLWIYWVGPLTGSVLAAFLYKVLIYVPKEPIVPTPRVDEATATDAPAPAPNPQVDDVEEIVIGDTPQPKTN